MSGFDKKDKTEEDYTRSRHKEIKGLLVALVGHCKKREHVQIFATNHPAPFALLGVLLVCSRYSFNHLLLLSQWRCV